MNNNHQMKQVVVNEIKEKIEKSKSITFVDYKGIKVSTDTALRKSFRENGAEYRVIKNRLLQKAFEELKIEGISEFLNGTTAVAFGYTDEVIAPRLIVESAEKNSALKVKCGIMNGKLIQVDEVQKLAKIPAKPILIAQLLSVLNGPASALARALDAISKKA